MSEPRRVLPWERGSDPGPLLTREWLVTNGLGGYSSGTLAGVSTRRYHGLLVAALPAPLGRVAMLAQLQDELVLPDGSTIRLGGEEHAGGEIHVHGAAYLVEFRLEWGLPVWRYEIGNIVLERRVLMPHMQNTVHVTYDLLSGGDPVRLRLRPGLHFRSHEAPVNADVPGPYTLTATDHRFELSNGSGLPPLRLTLHGGADTSFVVRPETSGELLYRVEAYRGYASAGRVRSPGSFEAELAQDFPLTFIASTEPWEQVQALLPEDALSGERERRQRLLELAPPAAREGVAAELVLAADQFVITPAGRTEEAARALAAGDEVRTVVAGYHWFTDWGRDTMISLDGLTLATGRLREASHILRTFALYVRDGLIPNMFPDGSTEGLYHTADATLWFFHAVDRYVAASGDRTTLRTLLPTLVDIVEHHLRGTHFGIGVDPGDGLLRQGAPGYQLTWMDAKVDEWVVTPRRGKAVEINALWYNALRLLENWLRAERGSGDPRAIAEHAERARASFNRRFWYDEGGYLYDVVDGEEGDDRACRPNQVFAISLRHPVLEQRRWAAVLDVVRERLLTPVGLRSLAPGHRDYAPRYFGDLRTRDAAYHQGTVWAWLIGPYVDAWLKVHPEDREGARRALEGLVAHLNEFGVGSVAEVFDAEPPYTPRGCIAQAWSVAELLRCWLRTGEPRD